MPETSERKIQGGLLVSNGNLSSRLKNNLHVEAHLQEISSLVRRKVTVSELEEPVVTKEIRDKEKEFSKYESMHIEIPFDLKSEKRFQGFITKLAAANPTPVYLWTSYANECGPLKLNSLFAVDYDFPFEVSDEGVFSLVTTDLADRLLLEFHEEGGNLILDIGFQGKHWSVVRY